MKFKHYDGCGSGSTEINLELKDGRFKIMLKHGWMGSDKFDAEIIGTYNNVDDNNN